MEQWEAARPQNSLNLITPGAEGATARRLRSCLVYWESHSELIERFEIECELVSGRVQ